MGHIKRFALPAACILSSMLAAAPLEAADKTQVTVTNTPAEAVPVAVTGTAPVNIVGPLDSSGAVQTVSQIKGIVNVRPNPGLTHVGALASDTVTLLTSYLTSGAIWEIHSDGTHSTLTTVPSGKALVITDLQWYESAPAGTAFGVLLSITPAGGSGEVAVFYDVGQAGANGDVTKGNAYITTGIAFGPGTRLGIRIGESGVAFAHGYYVAVP
jgi:hypothetical protein